LRSLDEMAHMHSFIKEADPAKYEQLRKELASALVVSTFT